MANIFNIDFSVVGTSVLPWFWNKTGLAAFIRSIMASIQVLSDKLLVLKNETDDFLQYTGQHKVMEIYLNSIYDPISNRIFITENNITSTSPIIMGITDDVASDSPVVMGITDDVAPTFPVTMGITGEVSLGNNFTVNMPTSIVYDSIVLDAQIRNYVSEMKNYNIILF